ncbi:MAG: response regulator [Betaproteobacteria bacterium]|nr:response regulator [Betaproteobacteria bacterium]
MDGGDAAGNSGGGFDRILVVEDDPFSRGLLVQLLANQGHRRVEVAADGRQALDRLRHGGVDLVLLDIEMPQLDGIEVLRRLKDDPRLSAIPVIVISGVGEVASIVRCIDLGAEDYLSKPFNPVILRARIGASLEKHRLRKLEAARLAQILQEQQKADRLLNMILPAAAARELKTSGVVAPRRHERVAVLFCDIVGFTAYCDRHRAEDVVARLQLLIECFERITERHRMEKIKTIGDSFMATAGMLCFNPDPLRSAVRCGLDMIAATAEVVNDWQVRVGIDYGPIVSGVLGRQKYQFDVWGSVVNIAARMTELASPGTVALSRDTWTALGGDFAGRLLGPRDVKGIGPIEVAECDGCVPQQ